tara:strand:- start:238 stop:621 length:384 start_codon:yes stop_codon:yes gene_type:complete
MSKKEISINVIATFEDEPQELFDFDIDLERLVEQKSELPQQEWQLVKEIVEDIEGDCEQLVKLSLCFYCNEEAVNKYPCIYQSIYENNGKYYFQPNQRGKVETKLCQELPALACETANFEMKGEADD